MPELQGFHRQFVAIEREAEGLLEGLTEAQLTWRDDARRWSIADCLNHLWPQVITRFGTFTARSRRLGPTDCSPAVPLGTASLETGSFV